MPFRFLALGDSYTVGEGLLPEEGWPIQLTARLAEEGITLSQPQIIAKTGWTSGELLDGIARASIKEPFDIVTLMIGVNNQYRKLDCSAYVIEFEKLLDKAIFFAGQNNRRTVVLSIPDWSVTPFALEQREMLNTRNVAQEIDAFNRANCRIAYLRKCPYVDVTAITRVYQKDPHAWAADGLHPSALMYKQWVYKLQPVVRALLRGK